ncbi:MAG TPA: hypothetical protein VIH96_05405 [Paraburkholderia sp.]|jgi:hypothetical protein
MKAHGQPGRVRAKCVTGKNPNFVRAFAHEGFTGVWRAGRVSGSKPLGKVDKETLGREGQAIERMRDDGSMQKITV